MTKHIIMAAAAAVALAACSHDGPTTPAPASPLAGLSAGASNDTTDATTPVVPTSPGSFHGVVLGHGTGTDTLNTAPRMAGSVITAYPLLGYDGDTPRVGDSVGTVTAGADGTFQFPTIAGGTYVVTVVPPTGSGYRGIYITATISNVSNSGSWWVVLSQQ
ncbi:MAG TPA: hypothetical protein VG916_11115 [Gemmatimonadaceae bacterium]|nr:hypothetical protein [Gemmatimonadaceae bacterium]